MILKISIFLLHVGSDCGHYWFRSHSHSQNICKAVSSNNRLQPWAQPFPSAMFRASLSNLYSSRSHKLRVLFRSTQRARMLTNLFLVVSGKELWALQILESPCGSICVHGSVTMPLVSAWTGRPLWADVELRLLSHFLWLLYFILLGSQYTELWKQPWNSTLYLLRKAWTRHTANWFYWDGFHVALLINCFCVDAAVCEERLSAIFHFSHRFPVGIGFWTLVHSNI